MSDILQGHGLPGCTTFYSSMGLQSGDCKNTVVLHRGHFLESAFRIMSTPIGEPDGHFGIPGGVETLKKKDASSIDVFWSNFVDDSTSGKEARPLLANPAWFNIILVQPEKIAHVDPKIRAFASCKHDGLKSCDGSGARVRVCGLNSLRR